MELLAPRVPLLLEKGLSVLSQRRVQRSTSGMSKVGKDDGYGIMKIGVKEQDRRIV